MKKKRMAAAALLAACFLTGCKAGPQSADSMDHKEISEELVWESSMELRYATEFQVDTYEGGYELLTIVQDGR